MTENHPITPPPELVKELWDKIRETPINSVAEEIAWNRAISQAVHWATDQANADIERKRQEAADQELEACLGWLVLNGYGNLYHKLRASRRSKPPSLKEQALDDLDAAYEKGYLNTLPYTNIHRALEQLND